MTALLHVDDLTIRFSTPDGEVTAGDRIGFHVDAGETVGLVGESGSGKSQAVLAILGLLAKNGRAEGSVRFEGKNLLTLPAPDLNGIRGVDIAMIFQDPMTALNPYLTVSRQMTEVLIEHRGTDAVSAKNKSLELLDLVGIPDPKSRVDLYPHEFSGGMRQRVDDRDGALVRTQAPDRGRADHRPRRDRPGADPGVARSRSDASGDMAILLITHDLGVIAGLADRVLVMYGGRIVEAGPVEPVFETPAHALHQGPAPPRPPASTRPGRTCSPPFPASRPTSRPCPRAAPSLRVAPTASNLARVRPRVSM